MAKRNRHNASTPSQEPAEQDVTYPVNEQAQHEADQAEIQAQQEVDQEPAPDEAYEDLDRIANGDLTETERQELAEEVESGQQQPEVLEQQAEAESDPEIAEEVAAEKPDAPVEEVAAAAAEVTENKNGRRKIFPHYLITEVKPNPKRAGTAGHARYALYEEGMTVKDYENKGGWLADVRWDVARQFIVLVDPAA